MKRKGDNGFIFAELVTALALFGIIVAGMAVTLHGFGMFNRYQWARRRCTAAAAAQLDSITATDAPIPAEDAERLWPEVETSLERSAAEPPWDGLDRVQVTAATTTAGRRRVAVELTRYLEPVTPGAEGGRP